MTVDATPLDADDLPAWAERHLSRVLGTGVRILNAHVVRRGAAKGAILVNTTEGSALLAKSRFGEPTLVRLPLPGERVAFTCVSCKEHMELHAPETPRPFYCTRCARPYRLTREGDAYVLMTEGLAVKRPERVEAPAAVSPHAVHEDLGEVGIPKEAAAPRPAPRPAASVAAALPDGPFRYDGYTLYTRKVTLKGGRVQRIHFFSRKAPKGATPSKKPADRRVVVTAHGMPVLRKVKPGEDTETVEFLKEAKHYRPQCQGLTSDGVQCRNSARSGSKYCASHHGYRPPEKALTKRRGTDTLPKVRGAKDTVPSYRKAGPKGAAKRKKAASAKKRSITRKAGKR